MSAERQAVIRRLAANIDAPRLARGAPAEMLGHLGPAAAARADDLALVVSELVTNAVVHGPDGHVELRLTVTGSTIRVEVTDGGTEPVAWPATDGNGHHGLDLVAMFSERAGIAQRPTTVSWCELDFA